MLRRTFLTQRDINEKIAVDAVAQGFNPTTFAPDTTGIPANSTRSYQLEIHSAIQKLFIPTTNNLRIRCYFAGPTMMQSTSTATIANLTVVSANLYLQGRVFEDSVANMLKKRFREGMHLSRGICRRMQTIPLTSVSGSVFSQTLSAFTGHMLLYQFAMVPQGAQNESICPNNWKAFNWITLQDSAGKPYGLSQIPQDLIRYSLMPSKYNTSSTTQVNFLEIDFCDNPVLCYESMVNRGDRDDDGKSRILVNPNYSGNIDLTILSLQESLVVQHPSGRVEFLLQ